MWERRPHSRAMARDMTVVDAPVSTQARRRLLRGGGGEKGRGGVVCMVGKATAAGRAVQWVGCGWAGGGVSQDMIHMHSLCLGEGAPVVDAYALWLCVRGGTKIYIPVVDGAVHVEHLLLGVQRLVHLLEKNKKRGEKTR